MPCSVCDNELESEEAQTRGLCDDCASKFGVKQPRPPSRRPAQPCTRCGHGQIVRGIVRDRAARGNNTVHEFLVPLAVTFEREVTVKVFGKDKVENSPELRSAVGILEVYVCRRCGLTEWYTQEPESIPIGPEHGTELLDYPEATPYR